MEFLKSGFDNISPWIEAVINSIEVFSSSPQVILFSRFLHSGTSGLGGLLAYFTQWLP